VDELMALCDELEAKQQHRHHVRKSLQASALDALTTASTAEALATAWTRLRDHWPILTSQPDSIPPLREAILELAVQGKLVRQNLSDKPAGDSLREAMGRIPKGCLVGAGLSLPVSWLAVSCADLCEESRIITYGVIKLGREVSGGVLVLRSSNVRKLWIDESYLKPIAPDIEEQYTRTRLQGGELVVTVRGTLGGVAVVPDHMAGYNVSREVAVIPLHSLLNVEYFALVIAAPSTQRWLTGVTRGIAYSGINIADLKKLPIPVPPFAEQLRIIAKVHELISLCDELEESATHRLAVSQRLTVATVAAA
jgi:type I restriction enzyme S subunit